jgi:hypothetical protein
VEDSCISSRSSVAIRLCIQLLTARCEGLLAHLMGIGHPQASGSYLRPLDY